MLATRQHQRVDEALLAERLAPAARQLGVDEGDVEAGVVRDQAGLADELEKLGRDRREERLIPEEGVVEAMHLHGIDRVRPLGIEVAVEAPPGRDVVDQLDAADLDDAVAGFRVEAGSLGIEDDFAHDSGRNGKGIGRRGKSRSGSEMTAMDILTTLRTRLFSAVVGDVMDELGLRRQFLPAEIRPLSPQTVLAGIAMPVVEEDIGEGHAGEAFGLMFRALDSLQRDEVYVCAGASLAYALWGGLMSTRALKLGAAGSVMDGYHRDTREIVSLGFPLFSQGAYAQDQKGRGRVTDFNVPVTFANGTRVAPGDIVFGDVDGVVVIPKAAAEEVVRLAVERVTGENTVRRVIEEGGSAEDAFRTTGIM